MLYLKNKITNKQGRRYNIKTMLTIEIQFFPYNCYSLFQNKLIFQTDSKISHALQLKVATTTKH